MKSFQKGKLVLSYKIVFSPDTEFIENENENISKQNCEIAAARRLLKRVAKKKPPICLATAMGRNKANHKKYILKVIGKFSQTARPKFCINGRCLISKFVIQKCL